MRTDKYGLTLKDLSNDLMLVVDGKPYRNYKSAIEWYICLHVVNPWCEPMPILDSVKLFVAEEASPRWPLSRLEQVKAALQEIEQLAWGKNGYGTEEFRLNSIHAMGLFREALLTP